MRQNAAKRIALLMGQDLGYCRRVLSGILAFAEASRMPWIFHDAPSELQVLPALEEWQPDGVIAHLFDRDLADRLLALGIPLVSTTDTLSDLPAPLVDVDHLAVGEMAADYFWRHGFRSFAYYGSREARFSRGRHRGFSRALEARGHAAIHFDAPCLPRSSLTQNWSRRDERTQRWLLQLPKPVAILASNDIPGRLLTEICRISGLRVPQEVAILGVDNDSAVCRMTTPPLSSIESPAEKIGWEAAVLLETMLAGKAVSRPRQFLPPNGVIERRSTDALAMLDPLMRRALKYIENHVGGDLDVAAVCAHTATSRRRLERMFRDTLDETIYGRIQKVRLQRAKRLLLETQLTVSQVAERAGFSGLRQLDRSFRQHAECAPSEFRTRRSTSR